MSAILEHIMLFVAIVRGLILNIDSHIHTSTYTIESHFKERPVEMLLNYILQPVLVDDGSLAHTAGRSLALMFSALFPSWKQRGPHKLVG